MNSTLPVIVMVVIAVAAASWYVSQGFKPARTPSATEKYLDDTLSRCSKSNEAEYRKCRLDTLCSEGAKNKTQACEYLNFTAYICGNLATACAQPQKAITACGKDAYCYHNAMTMIADRDMKAAIAICNAEADVSMRYVCYTDVISLSLKAGNLAESCEAITHSDYRNVCWKTANRQ